MISMSSITNYHSEGPPIFGQNAESQRAFVLENCHIVIGGLRPLLCKRGRRVNHHRFGRCTAV